MRIFSQTTVAPAETGRAGRSQSLIVAAEVTRLKNFRCLNATKAKSEPPHVGCYFFGGGSLKSRVQSSSSRDARIAPAEAGRAFSLIEILVTVALLTVIILGLVAMFNQTRKAFTSSFTQVDVLESGRSAADLMAREMEQMAPYGVSNIVNFYVDAPQLYNGNQLLSQQLVDPGDIRTNLLQEVFYLTHYNQQWSCVGYKVDTYYNGIGSLYRYSTNVYNWQGASNQLNYFLNAFASVTNGFSRLIDGVVDFRIHALDTNGIGYGYFAVSNNVPYTYGNYSGPLVSYGLGTNSQYPAAYSFSARALPYSPSYGYTPGSLNDFLYTFTSNSVPAYVELELGVVEDRTLARYNALTNAGVNPGQAAWNYLTNHPGQVHLFRQHVPIRNVNPAAYQ